MTENQEITLSELSKQTGIPVRKLLYRIKNKEIAARKIGWFWVIPVEEIEKVKALCN